MTDRKLLERAKQLGIDVKDTEQLLQRLEGARNQLSSAYNELRMQTTVIRERVAWLIQELDKLQDQIRRLPQPGESA
jgi:chromosome segregation ATPase